MYFIVELMPVILFFIFYKIYDIYIATYTIIIFSFFQILLFRYLKGRFQTMQMLTFFLFLCFGGMTIFLKNEIFIKIKPSILYIIMSMIFYISHFIGADKPMIKKIIGGKIRLPMQVWYNLSYSWIAFFIILSLLNLYIACNYETYIWMYFKLFGMMVISICFIILQFIAINKYIGK